MGDANTVSSQYKLGGFTLATAQPPEAILAILAKTFYKALIDAGKFEDAKDAGPFMQEPAAQAVAMWLSDEIVAREELATRVGLLQDKVDRLVDVVEKLQGKPGKEESDGENTEA